MSADDEPTRREVAVRVFAREFEDATLSYSESDEERAPTYVALPTGARANRVFVVGVLTAVGSVSDDVLRGRIADPTGAFVCYAGQYQPEAQRFLERTDPPAFVALTGKARTFEPDDGDAIYSSIRPETITTVDDDTRDRWVVQTAAATLDRCRIASDALDSDRSDAALTEWLRARGVDRTLAAGLPKAIDHYGLGRGYLSATAEMAIQTLGVVAGQRDAVDDHGLEPDTSGDRRTIPTIDTPLAIGGYTTPRQVFEATIEGASATTADSGDADTAESTASESETAGAETTASASAGAESSATESETVESAPDDTEREGTATDTGAVAVGTTGGSATTADDAAADSTGSSGTSDSTDDAIDS
ncbi:MAG: RPA family protein, partial [Halococcoides sp.]